MTDTSATNHRLGWFTPALWACACFALLAALSGIAMKSARRSISTHVEAAEVPVPA
jgi:hypothetical protein